MESRVVFSNVTLEYDSSFVLLKFVFQLSVFEMTQLHQRSKVNFDFVPLCFQNNLLFLLLTLSSSQA